jgi:hypothetical protein
MRQANDESLFTPFGLWVKEYLPQHFSVTDLDFVIEDYKRERLMIVEEKQNGGGFNSKGQKKTFALLDERLYRWSQRSSYDYWGFYLLSIPKTFIGPGCKLNGEKVTVEQLQSHLSFEDYIVQPFKFEWRKQQNHA